MEQNAGPVFVRGLSRSGGTLMCTLLDAHGSIGMSYELYPNLLEIPPDLDEDLLADAIDSSPHLRAARTHCPTPRFATFVLRCERGGLDNHDFARALRRILAEGLSLRELAGRMRMIELCGIEKANRSGKQIWGMKCVGDYEDYLDRWPDARFINVLRDGRDVLASQINSTGSERSPEQVAKAWINTHRRFERLQTEYPEQAYVVRYEELAHHPERELRAVCEFLNLGWDDALLHHNEHDLTVFSASHISRDRVSKSIDTTRIGRWRSELQDDELSAFLIVAEDGLRHFGYL